jgi:hypothetical protein
MMRHLTSSFQANKGTRGVHFHDDSSCNFLHWDKVLQFLKDFPERPSPDTFKDSLTEILANYDPRYQFLAVHQRTDTVTIELYEDPSSLPPRVKPYQQRVSNE